MANQRVIGVDIGNSSIKTAEFLEGEIGPIEKWKTASEVKSAFADCHFVVCSVGLKDSKKEFPNAFVLSHQSKLAFELDYDTPETLGVDRLAAVEGARRLFPRTNLLVIDGGSCVTYDFISSEGIYQGGIISPGIEMRLKAMNAFTDGLPLVKPGTPSWPGKSTEECLQLGADLGLSKEIEGVLDSFNKKYSDLQVVTTGGLLPSFESNLKKPIFASSKILLEGLMAIWMINEGT